MLGDEQRAWLRERLLDMTRPWAIVASGVVVNSVELPWPRPFASMNRLLPNGYAMLDGHVMYDDQWDGYPAERERVDWPKVLRYTASGVTQDFAMQLATNRTSTLLHEWITSTRVSTVGGMGSSL